MADYSSMPYILAALAYFEAGWCPIPIPYKQKSPVPDNTTGANAPYVTEDQVRRWVGQRGRFKGRPEYAQAGNMRFLPGNIGLRMPRNVLGIDIDMYGGKAGAETLAEAQKKYGPLPPTWISTSRHDGSGIRYFIVPEGLRWDDLGPGVETIKWYHRYAIVDPSIHDKTGKRYRWIRPDGQISDDEFPSIDELPMLPASWVAGLSHGGQEYVGTGEAGDIDYESAREWLTANGSGRLCDVMKSTLSKYTREVRAKGEEGGAHDAARDGAWAILKDAGLGHTGGEEAIRQLGAVFLTAVAGRREEREAASEWRRIVVKGVGKIREELRRQTGQPFAQDEDPCAAYEDEAGPAKEAGGGSKGLDWERDDIGNAQRLRQRVGTDALWVEQWRTWVTYDPKTSLWDRWGGNATMMRHAISVVRQMKAEAAFIEDPESLKAFKSWIKTSGSLQKLEAMMRIARTLAGLSGSAEAFDADWEALHVLNGVVLLTPNGVKFRLRRHEDMATLCAPVRFDPKAKSELWLQFLKQVLPDKDTRRWVQKLVGASLVGGNPDRSMVIGIGPTTSGKSTFVDVIATALGPYAATYNLQMFREKRDEGPRVDLLNALPKRFLHCTEASSEVTLHADSIKRMTGGDRVAARGMGSNMYVEAVPAFTPWLMTNEPPSVPGADAALRRRLKVAPFNVPLRPDQIDKSLKAKLTHEASLPGVLAWAVAGWELYLEEGLDDPGREVAEKTMDVRSSLSLLDAWMQQCCEFGAECFERTEDLHASYLAWLELNNEEDRRHRSVTGFGRALTGNNFAKVRKVVDGVQTMVRLGLQLKQSRNRQVN